MRRLPEPLSWVFPALTTHEGIPLGNGLFGALLWGAGGALRITINRADYWDHRGGITFGGEATYENLRRWLAEGNEAELRRVFEGRGGDGQDAPPRPTRLPMGRVDLEMADHEISGGALDLATGEARIALCGRVPAVIQAVVPRGRPLLAVKLQGVSGGRVSAASRPAGAAEVRAYWSAYGLPEPAVRDGVEEGGWYQALPADPGLYVAWRIVSCTGEAAEMYVVAAYGETENEARSAASAELTWAVNQGYDALADGEAAWWRQYWRQTPYVQVPDATIQEAYTLAMYKLAGIAAPGAPAASLQGPWVEEFRMPPWSSDYHFNINVQECYWPAYAGNHLETLAPLFDMIEEWTPVLRETARAFLGIDDGLMLHHSVDDRGRCMGGFWTGAIDHGSTGWVAHMMWQYYLYTLDEEFLRVRAYPFMKGAMRVYEEMLEETPDGRLMLPVSVSPEYGGAAMWAWGANASFQLAIIHFLCRALIEAVQVLGLVDDVSRWDRIDRDLPLGSIGGEEGAPELYLWDGQPLAHSHRHHSHLAGLYPFDVFDYWGSDDHRALLDRSAHTWTRQGMGEWSGWCMPWAAILWARMGNGERAALLLHEHQRVFVTPGRATTHDAVFRGFTTLAMRPDIMQIEAAMGAGAAVLEMLLHTAAGVTRVFPGVPEDWQEARFDGIRTEGALFVSAERTGGRTAWVRVRSERGGRLRLANPFGGAAGLWSSARAGVETLADARVFEVEMQPGEEIVLYPDE